MRFVADAMLGKLAKWLRVLGCDTRYRSYYKDLGPFVGEGRRLLTRDRKRAERFPDAVLIRSDRVGDQVVQLREELGLSPDRSQWFSRCLVCNAPLEPVQPERARENVPEYVFYRNMPEIRYCPACGRHYWPGSHRERMLRQLRLWGFEG